MNKIQDFWDGFMPRKSMTHISLPRGYIIRAIRVRVPKSMHDSRIDIIDGSRVLLSGRLWWFDGGTIPLDLDTSKLSNPDLVIENGTTRQHRGWVLLVTEPKSENLHEKGRGFISRIFRRT